MKRKNYYLLLPLILLVTSCGKNKTSEIESENASSEPTSIVSVDESEEQREFTYKEMTRQEVKDKVLGGWIGHAIGMGSGFEYVVNTDNVCEVEGGAVDGFTVDGKTAIVALNEKYFETNGQICNGSIGVNTNKIHPVSDPRVVRDNVYSDDDMHVDVLNQFIFRDYGPKLGNNDIASAWKFYDVHDVGGGADTRNLTQNLNYIPPYTGQSTYGCIGYWVTESWIENETLGMLFPYMYEIGQGYGEMFSQVQGDAYGYYLGKLCSTMYSLAYEYDDARTIIDKSFEIFGTTNELYDMYQYVKKCYDKKVSWKRACIGVVEKAVNCAKIRLSDTAGFSINANAGMIFIGLLYGENDFEQSIKITSLCGLDGDCTAATVGGLVGMMTGYENLPEKYTSYLNKNSKYHNYTGSNSEAIGVYWGPFAYAGKNFPNTITFDWLADLTCDNVESIIKEYNGEVNGENYKIAYRPLVHSEDIAIDNYSFEKGDTTSWNIKSKSNNATLTASTASVHIGTYGGLIMLEDEKDSAQVYQNVNLTKGNRYRASLWINGATDREFKIYAKDANNEFFRTYVNPLTLSNRHMKAELFFEATSSNMEIGIDVTDTYEDAYSTTVSIDDFFIDEVTYDYSTKNYQEFEAENLTLNDYARKEKDAKFSQGEVAVLTSDDSLEGSFYSKDDVQSIKFYYDNKSTSLATIIFYVDGNEMCNVPLVSTGMNNSYNVSNYAEIKIFVGKGNHTFKIENASFDDLSIDKIVIQNASKLLEA